MSDEENEEIDVKYKEEVDKLVDNMSKEDLIKLFNNIISSLKEETDERITNKIEFELACSEGDYEKVEKMINEYTYISCKKKYLETQIEFIEEEIKTGSKEKLKKDNFKKVLKILKSFYKKCV